MRNIELNEINMISGGSLREPISNPQSELGKSIDDVARGLNDFGSWLGGAIYDATH
jgi:hypothetical protein